ncbi:MAG TPA: 4-(cytidine 5'-diphospho)-2-C-methyl-D-erythritol kinase [Burkholderiaceae bacterium]|nr:4-(cytidine 5'-diphospho)-2-C-methyl-D-erythritol kinase [Burkholderiaceae bacterium]
MDRALALPAPAKINLFLHVLGRRTDGYHDLQSVLCLIDLADWIDIARRDDGQLRRSGDVVGAPDDDLALRAARLLQQHTGTRLGADIAITKRIPAGAGLGGGSSDAATTLIALNRLWDTGLDREHMAELGLALGADVPFFVHGTNAFAEGRGERLSPLTLAPAHYSVIWPQVHVSTKEIFEDPGLTRNTKATKMSDFSAVVGAVVPASAGECTNGVSTALFGTNDLEPVTCRRYPAIDQVLAHLSGFGTARMTGSGSAAFAVTPSAEAAQAAIAHLPPGWQGWAVCGLQEHPLRAW